MTARSDKAIRVAGLQKSYGGLEALRGIDFSVDYGECFALLGPNGAGKTTTVEILEGYRERSAGTVEVFGFDPQTGGRPFRERIGIVLQHAGIEGELKVTEALDYYGSGYPRRRNVGEVLEMVGLVEKRDARIKTLSGGQRRRLDLALVLIGDPDLLFLDEPTTGFDPSARRKSWELIEGLRSLGKTILLTTHYMDEAQNLADRVAVIVNGSFVAEGTPDTLAGREAGQGFITFRVTSPLVDLPPELPSLQIADGVATMRTNELPRVLHALTAWALDHGDDLTGLTVTRESLEDVYLRLTDGAEPSPTTETAQ
jgi:ABC-2 type transport system ATP-binding protein